MAVVALTVLLVLATLPVEVEAIGCPSAAEIERALAGRLPDRSDGMAADRARVWGQDGMVHLELVNADGAVQVARTLASRATCAETAELVAIVIASWESDVHPAFVRPTLELEPRPVGVPVRRSSSRASFDVGVGIGVGWSGELAAAGALAATWVPRGEGIGGRLWAGLDGRRTLALSPGQASWDRSSVGAAFVWRRAAGRAGLDLFAGAGVGRLSATGSGFGSNRSAVSFAPVATVGSRIAFWGTAHAAAWLGVEGMGWLRRQTVYSDPDGRAGDVPALELLAQVGLALGRSAAGR